MTSASLRFAGFVLALTLLPLAPSFAATPAAPTADKRLEADKAEITRLEQRWIAAITTGDRSVLKTILTDDFRDINWAGQVRDKHDLIADPNVPANTSQVVTQLDVRVWGDTAVATGINEVHSDKGWTVQVPFTDVFARIDGKWQAVSSQETMRRPASTQQPGH